MDSAHSNPLPDPQFDPEVFNAAAEVIRENTGIDVRPARAEQEWNAGARIADDHFCQGCGRRGIVGYCRECSR